VFVVLAPLAAAGAMTVFLASVWISRYVSLGSMIATVVLPALAYATGCERSVVIAGVAAASLILFRHRSNLARLRAGTERRLGTGATYR
jgi:glycerol-3-phosphate acyltransferase PlsY